MPGHKIAKHIIKHQVIECLKCVFLCIQTIIHTHLFINYTSKNKIDLEHANE